MGDSDHYDPGARHDDPHDDRRDDLDVRNFYRDDPYRGDLDRDDLGRTTARIDHREFYLPGEEPDRPPYEDNLVIDEVNDRVRRRTPYTEAEWRPAAEAAPQREPAAIPDPVPQPEPVLPNVSAVAIEPAEPAMAEPVEAAEAALPPAIPAEPTKIAQKRLVRFAAIGVILGVVFGAMLIGFTWLFAKPSGPYDLGAQTSNAVGLKGHLYTKWEDDKVQYRLSFLPTDPDLHTPFSNAIDNPPRPLSIAIQLKDAMGFALCSREILLPYNPPPPLESASGQNNPPAQDPAQIAAAERQREQGKDVFAERRGPDGQIDSIDAQGAIPCSQDAYGKIVAWSFTPDFPSLAEQNDLIKQKSGKETTAQRAASTRRRAPRGAEKALVFSIEGDDSVVGYDPATGTLETGSGETFFVDRDANLSAWQNFPIQMHYRCDQISNCMLSRPGSGSPLHARIRK